MKKNASVLNTVVNDLYNHDKFWNYIYSFFQSPQKNTRD